VAGDTCGLSTQGHWCFPRQKTAIGNREFAVFTAVVLNSLPLELRMLSCSVQTFVQTKETPVYQLIQAHLRIFYFAALSLTYKCTPYWYYYYTTGK